MRSIRDARSKIGAVRSIEQICHSMKAVSSIRLRRAEQRVLRGRPYHEQFMNLVGHVSAVSRDHPFLQEREVRRTGLVVVTSDRGLCGGYNAATVRRARAVAGPEEAEAVAVGRQSVRLLEREGYAIVDRLVPLGAAPRLADSRALAMRVGQRFIDGRIDRLLVIYTEFLGGMHTQVAAHQVLPVPPLRMGASGVIFEPPARELLPRLMDRYLRDMLVIATLESAASEHAARVSAMTSASGNAEEMIERLTLEYNSARQTGITQELIEIVSAGEPVV